MSRLKGRFARRITLLFQPLSRKQFVRVFSLTKLSYTATEPSSLKRIIVGRRAQRSQYRATLRLTFCVPVLHSVGAGESHIPISLQIDNEIDNKL